MICITFTFKNKEDKEKFEKTFKEMYKEAIKEKDECIIKGCKNKKYKDKLYCKNHLNKNRKSNYYKNGDM